MPIDPALEGQISCGIWVVTLKTLDGNSNLLQICDLYTIWFHILSYSSWLQFARVLILTWAPVFHKKIFMVERWILKVILLEFLIIVISKFFFWHYFFARFVFLFLQNILIQIFLFIRYSRIATYFGEGRGKRKGLKEGKIFFHQPLECHTWDCTDNSLLIVKVRYKKLDMTLLHMHIFLSF